MADPKLDQFLTSLSAGPSAPPLPPSYARRPRPSVLVRLIPLWIVLGVCGVVAIAVTRLRTPEGRTIVPSAAQPAWQRAVVDYIKAREPLLSVKKIYRPEPLQNSSIYMSEEHIWFELLGEYAGIAVNDNYNPGTGGFCDATCKFGVRVEYEVDEGFDRVGYEDRVFFLKSNYAVTGYAPTDKIRFRGVITGDAAQKDAADFLSGESRQ